MKKPFKKKEKILGIHIYELRPKLDKKWGLKLYKKIGSKDELDIYMISAYYDRGICIADLDNLSEKEFYNQYLKNLTRDHIDMSRHGRKKTNKRHVGVEQTKDILTERFHKKIHKNEDGDFEIVYESPNKDEKDDIVIIVVPLDSITKSIRVVTVYKE